MFTLISDQTAWYLNQSSKLEKASIEMNMHHQKGRHQVFTKSLNTLIFTRNLYNIAMGLTFQSATDKVKKELRAFDILIEALRLKIINNGYVDNSFKNGAVTPISKQSNPYHCMHKSKLHEHILRQHNGY